MPTPRQPSLPLGPPQFGLRALLLAVSAVAVLFGLWQWLSPITFAVLILLVLTILAHIAGNVIGSRLRDGRQGYRTLPEQHEHTSELHDHHFAPVTRLGQRHSLGWLPLLSAIAGTTAGAGIGGGWTAVAIWNQFDWLPVVIAAVAFGVLGGLGGFLTAGFLKALGDAWSEAAKKE